MTILFIISCINSKSKGLGGHYHSLKETIKSLKSHYEISLVCVGNIYPKALINFDKEVNIDVFDITSPKFKPLKTLKKINEIIEYKKIDIFHSFDRNALFYGRLIALKFKKPSVYTKCGGNNQGYIPYSENIICFSKENYEYINTLKKFSISKKHLVPNRIQNFESNIVNIEKIKKSIKNFNESYTLLRISRIGRYYMKTNKNLIHLVKKLNEDGIKCKGIFVGTVEDNECLNELKKESDKNIFFFTDDEITKNAKSIIDIADIVIGTGRSIMEGMSKSKIVLSPIKSSNELILVNSNNFNELFYYNFSERCKVEKFDSIENFNLIKDSLTKNNYKEELKSYIENIYFQYFDACNLNIKHEEVYKNASKNKKFNIIDFIIHYLLQHKIYRQKPSK